MRGNRAIDYSYHPDHAEGELCILTKYKSDGDIYVADLQSQAVWANGTVKNIDAVITQLKLERTGDRLLSKSRLVKGSTVDETFRPAASIPPLCLKN